MERAVWRCKNCWSGCFVVGVTWPFILKNTFFAVFRLSSQQYATLLWYSTLKEGLYVWRTWSNSQMWAIVQRRGRSRPLNAFRLIFRPIFDFYTRIRHATVQFYSRHGNICRRHILNVSHSMHGAEKGHNDTYQRQRRVLLHIAVCTKLWQSETESTQSRDLPNLRENQCAQDTSLQGTMVRKHGPARFWRWNVIGQVRYLHRTGP